MSLQAGTRLGSYEVVSVLGVGGMGEVYRARDTRLKRDVAIKVVRPDVAHDPERLARFEREARVLAALNHPHIAQILHLETSGAVPALVLELVDGPTLADRIADSNGRGVPIDEALPIARQIAEALEAAHEQGIVHRDLKPANVKVRPDGDVKVLDFGLAKAVDAAGEPNGTGKAGAIAGSQPISPALPALSSPTITSPAQMTALGVILGTAAYMSPEQAKGRPADHRSDIWAFGCVLYEMLTGQRPFHGADVAETLASVIKTEPDWTRLPASTPRGVRTLLRRCLQKDRIDRLDSAAAARLELQDALTTVDVPARVDASGVGWWRAAATVAAAVSIVALVLVGIANRNSAQVDAAESVVRFSVAIPSELRVAVGGAGSRLALSPDGRTVVYGTGAGQLVKRRIDSDTLEVLTRGRAPFFSPDSAWLGFFEAGALKKILVDGGQPVTVCAAITGYATWGDDGTIVFATRDGLFSVSSDGGTPEPVGPPDAFRGLRGTAQPLFLPGARALIVSVVNDAALERRLQALTRNDGRLHDVTAGSSPMFGPDGKLLFTDRSQLWAASLDQSTWTISGTPRPVLDGFRIQGTASLVSVAANGTLAYVSGENLARSSVVWIDRVGKSSPALRDVDAFLEPRLSPDGARLAVSIARTDGADVWVYDLARGTRSRLTQSGDNQRPSWSPDGARVAFQALGEIRARNIDDTNEVELVKRASGSAAFPDAYAPDGTLVYNLGTDTRDLWALRSGSPSPERLTSESPFSERSASVSPDGRWLLFASNESGRDDIYLQPFRRAGAKTVVSTQGGKQPLWSRDGREIYYRIGDSMMVVPFSGDPSTIGIPRELFGFPRALYGDDSNRVEYDVAADGRFLATRADDSIAGEQLRIVVNWTSTLNASSARRSVE